MMLGMEPDVVQAVIAIPPPPAEVKRRRPVRLIAAALVVLLVAGVVAGFVLVRRDSSSGGVVTTTAEKQHAAVALAKTLVPEVAGSTDAQLQAVGTADCKVLSMVKPGDKSAWAQMVLQNVSDAGMTRFHAAQLIDLMVRGFCPGEQGKIVDTFSP